MFIKTERCRDDMFVVFYNEIMEEDNFTNYYVTLLTLFFVLLQKYNIQDDCLCRAILYQLIVLLKK